MKTRKIIFYVLMVLSIVFTLVALGLMTGVIANNQKFDKYVMVNALYAFTFLASLSIIGFLIFFVLEIKNREKKEKTAKEKIFYILIILSIIFTIILFGLLGGVLANNDSNNIYEINKWRMCRNAMFAFSALLSLTIIGLLIFLIFRKNIFKEKNIIKKSKNNKLKKTKELKKIDSNDVIEELKKSIDLINSNIKKIYPIGTILISTIPPKIGQWTDLGELLNGQMLLGGDSLKKEISFSKNIQNKEQKIKIMLYGLGIGKGFHVWRRDV